MCGQLAEREGDRLLKENDRLGAEVAHRIAALIRIRRDQLLEPFIAIAILGAVLSLGA
jgi:hypothetical protein